MLYPLKFRPVLKEKIWGGSKLKTLFGKKSNSENIGESWELSGYEGDESIVVNGFLAGNNLTELVEVYMDELVGEKIYAQYGAQFPLLFKLIDANENLSIQVHPNDAVAAERHNSFGKTEMWYVVDAEQDAELIIGFVNDCNKDDYERALTDNSVEKLLQHVKVAKGDVLFIPAGLVHAICKGVVVAEIQQSSDITYRIYDYKRTDSAGRERELHIEQALDVINFAACRNPKVHYHRHLNEIIPLVECNYFTTNIITLNEPLTRNYGAIDSFKVYMCVEGQCVFEYADTQTIVNKGDTILVPAAITEINIMPETEATLLEVYI
ncbi:MAG: class I mannose-6-phosphate isomerase [Paludibacter sp.]|jgi:mannose-6-phosphate isomerase|nr:class I mannose-6-phosphate isomerase [Paludibacter sp.]